MPRTLARTLLAALSLSVVACSEDVPLSPDAFEATDAFVATVTRNISENDELFLVADIDHARLGAAAGSVMPPARVLIFSDPQLESELIALNHLVALDLPLRLLAFDEDGEARVTANEYSYLVSRYGLEGTAPELGQRYDGRLAEVLAGVPETAVARFTDNSMQPDGVITLASPYSFDETVARVNAAIDAQDDTVHFGVVDFQANARELGISLQPAYMILFGGPGPGGKAMAGAPTLGLDAFCQKFLIWEDESGSVYLSFNDLVALAKRQNAAIAPALRVINLRLNKVFTDALED